MNVNATGMMRHQYSTAVVLVVLSGGAVPKDRKKTRKSTERERMDGCELVQLKNNARLLFAH